MTENEFVGKYGAADEDLVKVSAFARKHRLNVIETEPSLEAYQRSFPCDTPPLLIPGRLDKIQGHRKMF
jgi:hypothetical protein